jgi:signal transduction histidine kinase
MSDESLLQRIDNLEREAVEIAVTAAATSRESVARAAAVQRRLHALIDALSNAQEDREAALRLNSAKTRLMAEVGHDLTQPLAVIIATLERLATTADELGRSWIDRANAAAGRLERAFAALMEKARLEVGVVEPKRQRFALDLLFDELRDQHEDQARKKSLELRVVPSGEMVLSDPTLLASILHNLVSNGIRYTERGHVEISTQRREGNCLIEVEDTGIGIAETQMPLIFDEFRQLASVRGRGMGLGLSIVKRTAELLGHRLSVQSTLGAGSRFSIEVPSAPEAHVGQSQSSNGAADAMLAR